MGSSSKVDSTMMRKKLSLIAKKPNVESLIGLRRLMDINNQSNFNSKYGRLLDLLKINVQVGAITALAQFYDPPTRCFIFKDFVLAPTLEEFEKILGLSLDKGNPYQYLGHYPKTIKVAKMLKVEKLELKTVKQKRKGTVGYLRSFFENRARQLAKEKDWDTFKEVLALIIYGVVLFPKAEDLIDKTAIDVFLAFKNRGENPVPAVLADVYYSLNYCHEMKGERILCCLPVLYVWLVTHMYDHKCTIVSCPFSDYNLCDIKIKNGGEWAQDLANLREKRIRWYPKWKEVEEVIYRCGAFPNVPLIGTKGCISYNPALVLRQLCYPIMEPPTEEMITPFVLYDMGPKDMEVLRKVRKSWNKVVKKGKDELGKRCCDVKESYRDWIRERVKIVKLPFKSSEDSPIEVNVENNSEIEKFKVALLKAEEEKKDLQKELRGVRRAYEKLEEENVQHVNSLEKANKIAKLEESRKLKFQDNLRVSNELLTKEREERYMACDEVENLKRLLTNSQRAEQNVKRQLEDLQNQLKNVVAEYEKRVENEKQQKEELVSTYHDLWREAEAIINPLSTPQEIIGFIEYCKTQLEQIGEQIRRDR